MNKNVKEYINKFEKREGIESAADVVDLAKEMVKATLQEMF